MMGKREIKLKGGGEWDALSPWTKYLRFRPGDRKLIKRKFNKRVRQWAKAQIVKGEK